MFRNYLKVALRSLLRSKLTSVINIAGLALAMACSLLILLFVMDEWSYDRYHSNANRIYRVTRNFLSPDGSVNLHLGHVAPPFGPLLKNDFPEFEEVVRTLQTRLLVAREEQGQERVFNENNAFFAEPEIFNVFDIAVTEGNPQRALTEPFHLMLSEKTAKKYFGNSPALGKTLKVNDLFNLEVSGVFRDFPAQSHWHPEVFISFSTLNDSTIYGREALEHNWGNNAFSTYVLAKAPFDAAVVERQFPAFLDRHMSPDMSSPEEAKPSTWTHLFLQKLTDIHLRSHLDSEIEGNGDINTVYMMGVIGLFIVLIACFNFVNLSTARATRRAKEVGLRKVVGAVRPQLIAQHLSESVIIALVAFVGALGIAGLALPWLNGFTGKELTLTLTDDWKLLLALLGGAFVVGCIAGIYPAFVISSFRPSAILKGQQGSVRGKAQLRKVLVVSQFAISIVLIIATLVTFRQLRFLNQQPLGYDKDQVVLLRYYNELDPSYDAFYNELTRQTGIRNVARSSRIPTGRLLDSRGTARVQQGDSLVNTDVVIKNIAVDHQFFDTYGIPFVAGRNFSKAIKTDDSLSFILNESAVRMIGVTPEEILTKDFQYGGVRGRVIGVVRDFHFESLREPIVPMVFHIGGYGNLSIKAAGSKMQDVIARIENVWKDFLPHHPFEYNFLSMQYAQLYDSERRQGELFIIFSGLAIFIASLGLFGLATFNTLQRIREIGIRKVLGASTGNIVRLLSAEIVLLILIASIIAWPIAWYFTSEWLKTFAYRIDNSIFLYVFSALAAVVIALLTVSTQTFRAALSNPAETLRNE